MSAKAMAQQVCTLPQLMYPAKFYSLSSKQHDTLTALLIRPLRKVKRIGTRLHSVVLSNQILRGFTGDIQSMVQEVKLSIFERRIAEGGLTRCSIECLCLRLLRTLAKDWTLIPTTETIPSENDSYHTGWDWWAESLIDRASENFTDLVAKGFLASGHRHISSWAKESLSPESLSFIAFYDLSCVEELISWDGDCWEPLAWLNSPGLQPGGPDLFRVVDDLLAVHSPGKPRTNSTPGIGVGIPVVREQMYMLSPRSCFQVAGILPSGRITGRFYSLLPKFSACLIHQRGSGFDTSLSMDDLRAPGVRWVFASYGRGATYWMVHLILEPRVLATPVPLSPSPSIPALPPCLRPVIHFLADHGITPTHMSSDASFDCVGGPPSSVFYRDDPEVSNCTSCVIVAGTSFVPG
jgi:hypothetical protein